MKANLYSGRGTWPDWNDPNIRQREQMPPHAYKITFPDLASCRHAVTANRRYLSPYVINLTDGWENRFYQDIIQLPENILSFRSGFEPTPVPGGRLENKTNEDNIPADRVTLAAGKYPFPVTPPLVPSSQPILVYRRTCRLPLLWGGLRKRLVLQGIHSACHIFVNGKLIGYTQGSFLPAEFDLTSSLHDGDNELFILAYPRCTGSYLEKYDPGMPFGLVRDVYIEATPPICVQDIQVRTKPSPDEEFWQLDLAIELFSYRISTDTPQVRISLWQEDDCLSDTLWPVPLIPAEGETYRSPVQSTGSLTANLLLQGILPWSDETPMLYDLFVSVEDKGNRELSCQHLSVGFRHLSWQKGQLRLNNRPLQLRAARISGQKSWKIQEMLAQLRQIKQANLNALYISDYPSDPILLELCDIFGFYVLDEAPLDVSHPLMLQAIQDDPHWLSTAQESMEKLIRRDFNHPCVLFWSAGLFRQDNPMIGKLVDYIRTLDESRGVHLFDIKDICRNLNLSPVPVLLTYPTDGGQCYCDWSRCPSILRQELKQALRPLDFRAIDASSGAFMIVNRLNWTAAAQFRIDWLLLRDGHPILTGELDNVRTAPGNEQYIELYYGDLPLDDGSDYVLRFEVSYSESVLWADEGEEAFFQEFLLTRASRIDLSTPSRTGGRLRLESDRHHLIVSGSRFWLVFNRINGTLESWRYGDKELIAAALPTGGGFTGLQGTISRPYEPLDEPWIDSWRLYGYNALIPQVVSAQDGCDGQSAVIEMVIRFATSGQPACAELLIRYEIRASGDLLVYTGLHPLLPDLPPWPCFGLNMNLKPEYEQVNWLGTGPETCLTGLQNNKRNGIFSININEPAKEGRQSAALSGMHPDTRWLSVKDASGFGLLIRSDQLFGHVVRQIGIPGLTEKRLERQASGLQLFAPVGSGGIAKPIKASWHFCPVVSDTKLPMKRLTNGDV